MRKFGVFTSTVFACILLAGVYGIVHDQITCSISPEYFTRFKYRQFGLDPGYFGGNRPSVAVIGFLATWWMGLIIGVCIGLAGFVYPDHITMRRSVVRAVKTVLVVSFVSGLTGFAIGKFYLVHTGVDWPIPADVIDRKSFIITGSIHNFSYPGGLAGLFVALTEMIRRRIYGVQ